MALERSRWTDDRLDGLAVRMNDQFAELVATMHRMESRLDRLDDRFDRLDDRFDRLENSFDRLEDRFDRIEEKVDRLRSEFYTTRLTVVGIWIGLAAIFIEIALRT
jgi:predicted nuclease with TOPRIM domain